MTKLNYDKAEEMINDDWYREDNNRSKKCRENCNPEVYNVLTWHRGFSDFISLELECPECGEIFHGYIEG